MKIEIHYLSPRHPRFFGTKVEVTLNQCNIVDLVPAYRIVKGSQTETLYRYNGKLWAENPVTNVKGFVQDLQYGLYCAIPEEKLVDDEWMSTYLGVGEHLFQQVKEPFYYLDANASNTRDMVKVSYTNEGIISTRRHYAPNERDIALRNARQIRELTMPADAPDTPKWRESIIEVLNPDGSVRSQDAPQKRYFQCRHCGERVFADIPIQMDHLIRNHPDTLSLNGYPMDTTEEDVIHVNFVEEPKQADNAPMATTSKPNVSKVTPVAVGTCPCQDLRSNKDREWQRDYQKQGDSFPDKQDWDRCCASFGMKPEDFGREVECGNRGTVRIIKADKTLVKAGYVGQVFLCTMDIVTGRVGIFNVKALKKFIPDYRSDKKLYTQPNEYFEKAEWDYWIRQRVDLKGFEPADYGKHFFANGREYEIVGIASNAVKYPVIAQDVQSKRLRRFAPEIVYDGLRMWPSGKF